MSKFPDRLALRLAGADVETMVEAMARAQCNALPAGPPELHLGHRYSYPSCVGPDCSCWDGRRRLARAALLALAAKPETPP